MKNDILNKLTFIKLMLLLLPCYKRQKFIDALKSDIEKYLAEFNEDAIKEIKEQIKSLDEYDCNELFSESFGYYRFLKFGKGRLEIDDYKPEDCRTFAQYNDILRLGMVAIDYEKKLEAK